MKRNVKFILVLLLAMLFLNGCMRTVDQMYRPPKRSDVFTELQLAIDGVMSDLTYCAPLSGEHQQAVQSVDLNGDGVLEYLVFAKADDEYPLRILIFQEIGNAFSHVQTIVSTGTSFDAVEYSNMDDTPGFELIFGSQLTDQLIRNVSAYSFGDNLEPKLLISTNYTEFLTVNLDGDDNSELFVLKPGQKDGGNGIAELYRVNHGKIERSNEKDLSGSADKIKRILTGKIHDGIQAVYVATTVDDSAVITDVYVLKNDLLENITLSNESGTSVKTLRNYYVYADDIDGDEIVELPYLMPMMPMENMSTGNRQELIRWYAMTADADEVIKAYTFHNFIGGWYLELDSQWASRLTVVDKSDEFVFYIWDTSFENAEMVMTLTVISKQNKTMDLLESDQFVLYENDSIAYVAKLSPLAQKYSITQEQIVDSFCLIKQEWKTGET